MKAPECAVCGRLILNYDDSHTQRDGTTVHPGCCSPPPLGCGQPRKEKKTT